MSQSVVLERALSQQDFDPTMQKSSILSSSAQKSLNKDTNADPYFPHRYIDKKVGEQNKWLGTKDWDHSPIHEVKLPSIQGQYVSKWK